MLSQKKGSEIPAGDITMYLDSGLDVSLELRSTKVISKRVANSSDYGGSVVSSGGQTK